MRASVVVKTILDPIFGSVKTGKFLEL
jgi:hypothetical protein